MIYEYIQWLKYLNSETYIVRRIFNDTFNLIFAGLLYLHDFICIEIMCHVYIGEKHFKVENVSDKYRSSYQLY